MTVTVVIADDHPTFREGLRAVLHAQADIEVLAEHGTGEGVVASTIELGPDVVVMDLRMPGIGGVEATRRIRAARPGSRVLVLTMSASDDSLYAALRAGARGYLLKDATPTEIVGAVRAVASGQAVFGEQAASRLTGFFAGAAGATVRPFPELSERERDVLQLLADGCSNAAIAHRLVLSPKTVRNHVSTILSKLQLEDRGAAAARARQAGLGSPSR